MIVPSASSQISRLVCVSMDRPTLKDMDRSRGRGSGAPRRQGQVSEPSSEPFALPSSTSRTYPPSWRASKRTPSASAPRTEAKTPFRRQERGRQLRYSELVRSDQPSCGNLAGRWPLYFRVAGGWNGRSQLQPPSPCWGRLSAAREMKEAAN